ncbi:hypothetical protein CRG98_035201 [Punica granatum]|uniref:Uncharacterized protein n=1 Tax=Punica granatum TaxID=22663 RepID=A0A2I0IK69_PUNGR|nr:hypothetical protein CRG98_035201 [Punica granatum]
MGAPHSAKRKPQNCLRPSKQNKQRLVSEGVSERVERAIEKWGSEEEEEGGEWRGATQGESIGEADKTDNKNLLLALDKQNHSRWLSDPLQLFLLCCRFALRAGDIRSDLIPPSGGSSPVYPVRWLLLGLAFQNSVLIFTK